MTAVDCSTRWAKAWPLKVMAAADYANAFIIGWVARFGVPTLLTSERGMQGISHKVTAVYHPQSNGAVERFHC
jgi:transposase InsO family protein